ncbi:MAG: thiamine pyrophosphate-dependent enzyme [Elusimicrobiota bacterium]|nr:thiamine pyrophosphate-dependent enzyme [Elusimicrobiota bacterium]
MKFTTPESLKKVSTHYCPGCGHGIIHRIMAEAIDELGIREKVVAIAPVGCAVFGYFYWNFDTSEAAHGRPPAVATGIKRTNPEKVVFTYQGDGDLAAIGGNEILHAANRGENISVFFVNNACYGMTGGQMAPTTLFGQVTTTTPSGRTIEDGYPIKVCEVLSSLEGAAYLERVSVTKPANIMKAKRAIKKSLRCQLDGKGFSLVEFLSMCPTGWKTSPVESLKLIEKNLTDYFPLGVYRDLT